MNPNPIAYLRIEAWRRLGGRFGWEMAIVESIEIRGGLLSRLSGLGALLELADHLGDFAFCGRNGSGDGAFLVDFEFLFSGLQLRGCLGNF